MNKYRNKQRHSEEKLNPRFPNYNSLPFELSPSKGNKKWSAYNDNSLIA